VHITLQRSVDRRQQGCGLLHAEISASHATNAAQFVYARRCQDDNDPKEARMDPETTRGETGLNSPKKVRTQRSRPSKSLPSDRMKFEVQLRVLQTFGRLAAGGRVIDPERLSAALNNEVSKYTAPLSHGFFVESGWLNKVGRGEYTATDALAAYTRRNGAGADDPLAPLRMTATGSWYWRTVEQLLQHGEAQTSEVVVALMQEATVGDAHAPQIKMLLEWLKFLGFISISGDSVRLASPTAQDPESHDEPQSEPDTEPAAEPEPEPMTPERPGVERPRTQVPRTTTSQASASRPMLTFGFSCSVTADDLARLDAVQIRALFEAVGTVAAITQKQE
jgi:hypothetical protein